MDRDTDNLIYLALKCYLRSGEVEHDSDVNLSKDLPFKDEMTNLNYT